MPFKHIQALNSKPRAVKNRKKEILASTHDFLTPAFSKSVFIGFSNHDSHMQGDSHKQACGHQHNCFMFARSCNATLASPFEARKDQQNKAKSHNKTQLLLDPFLLGSSSA